ncbi:cytosolic protein [Cytobacillus sp. S13-E01]|uniref:cytosolic protein n=1 Tax=Cytobacillus sp. S13-E01 TaxID=3031326 RepID=UPI0023D8B877|nr:cytosolic protein [Cytobacillus sp. S13-E01]MDF0727491.1 cytosolic protein [Cytobacillus sp. S13-E01]
MGFKQSMQTYISNHSETSDNHQDELLRSHYYKTTSKKAMEAVRGLINQLDGYSLTSFSEEHGEMSVSVSKGRKAFMVITIISVRPFETAIDFSVTTETTLLPMDFGYSKKLALLMYEKVDAVLPLLKRN